MRRGQHHVERSRLLVGEIEVAGCVDVCLDALQQPESAVMPRVDAVNGQTLRGGVGIDMPPAILSPYEWSVTAA